MNVSPSHCAECNVMLELGEDCEWSARTSIVLSELLKPGDRFTVRGVDSSQCDVLLRRSPEEVASRSCGGYIEETQQMVSTSSQLQADDAPGAAFGAGDLAAGTGMADISECRISESISHALNASSSTANMIDLDDDEAEDSVPPLPSRLTGFRETEEYETSSTGSTGSARREGRSWVARTRGRDDTLAASQATATTRDANSAGGQPRREPLRGMRSQNRSWNWPQGGRASGAGGERSIPQQQSRLPTAIAKPWWERGNSRDEDTASVASDMTTESNASVRVWKAGGLRR